MKHFLDQLRRAHSAEFHLLVAAGLLFFDHSISVGWKLKVVCLLITYERLESTVAGSIVELCWPLLYSLVQIHFNHVSRVAAHHHALCTWSHSLSQELLRCNLLNCRVSAHNLLNIDLLLLNLHLQFLLLFIHLVLEVSKLVRIHLQSLPSILLTQQIHVLILI